MSVAEPPRAEKSPTNRNTAGRLGVLILMVISLIATGWMRDSVIAYHDTLRNRGRSPLAGGATSNDVSLSSLPSFATALLLGGLRGPLVMILWTSSENQKQQHDLQDFDTKVEWIRLLQPEFDTVHLFQIWNKAYNISVQMASLRNKYTTILDAIDYGQKVDKERPDDINIIMAVAALYGDKLGTSSEHVYYRSRIRRESQTLTRVQFPVARADEFRALAIKAGWIEQESPIQLDEQQNQTDKVVLEPIIVKAISGQFTGDGISYTPETHRESQQNDPTWRRVRLDPMLDQDGNILPSYLQPRYARPADLPASQDWYDGSALQFLKPYQPFPYGLSTLALAFNDYKRCQLLQSQWKQHHIQMGDTVIDARPALTLKDWAHDEWERGRRFECRMWGISVPDDLDPNELERPTAMVPFTASTNDQASYQAALYSYALSARLFADARTSFAQHIEDYKMGAQVYFVHIDDSIIGEQLLLGDYDYLAAISATGAERNRLLQSAFHAYYNAMVHSALTIMKYYVDDEVAAQTYPKDPKTGLRLNKATIGEPSVDPSLYMPTLQAVLEANARFMTDPQTHQYAPVRDMFHDDRETYINYISRCQARLGIIQSAATQPSVR